MARSLIPIVDIANNVCEDVGDHTKKHQRFVLRHLARCFQNLHLFMTPFTTVKTEVFSLGNVIEMPKDFVYETKVGIKMGDDIVFINKNYDKNSEIEVTMNQSEFENYVIDALNPDINRCVTPFYNYIGELVLSAYGSGGYCDGLYKVDYKNGRIYLGSNIPRGCEVVVEYKSDGVSDGLDLVPTEMESALYNYGLWQYFFMRSDGRFRAAEQNYDTAYYQLQTLYRFKPISYISKLYESDKGTINDFI